MERLFSLTRALVARKRKIFALFFALAASVGMSFAQASIVSSGTKGGMSYTFYDIGLLEISGSGALPGHAFTNWNDGFGASVKNIRFAEDCEVYGLDYMWFACYTEKSQLETIEINSVTPIMFSGSSGAGITYKQDGAVTITITAPGIVDIENKIIRNYGSPVNMIFNMPATTVFEKKWFSSLENYFAVTIPTGAKGHIPGGYSFTNPYDQQDYDHFVEMGHEADFWEYNGDRLTEGVDYTLGVESTFVITAENASQIFGQATVSFQAPTQASNSEWVLWRKSDLKTFSDMSSGDQKVYKDVTVKVNNGVYNTDSGFGVHFDSSDEDGVQFVAPEGKVFKRIVILNEYGTFSDPNWSYDGNYKKWSGSANTVGFEGDICGISLIEFEVEDSAPAAPANSCGDGVIWELNDGEMTISYTGTGTGAMENYSYYTKTPWYNSRKSITSIIIQDGVTTVGNYSFMDLENLQSVVIGNDVVTIGSHAFEQCGTSFTSLTLGNSIVEIGEQAFINNSRITSINFPSTLQTIGEDAFYGCTKISSLTIPSSVTSIGDYAFGGCSLIAYIIAEPTTPPSTEENTFISIVTPSYIPLYVPNGSVAAYTAADRWNTFNIQGYDPSTGPTIEPVPATPDQLSGAFTINGDGDQINFSKGNLQYVGSWRFAENQWNIIGNDQADNNRDLFGWGTGDAPNKVSTTLADYAVYHEWGTNMGDGWYTLSRDEWTYLFQSRTNAANLYAPARVNGVSGFVILPDEFTLPSGLSFTAGVTNYGTNFYANAAWRAMENAGAVFLPVDGYRYHGNKIKWVGQSGFYWSSTVASEGASAWSWLISASDGARRDYYNLHYGMCVRLVKAVVLTPDDVMALINAIGTVEYTAESKKKIDAARKAYDGLSEADKALVTNYSTLQQAEAAYQAFIQAEADKVIAKIAALPNPVTAETAKLSVYNKVVDARTAYDALKAEEKALVTNLAILEAAEAFFDALPGGIPEGALKGAFTINAGGDRILFSKGNLQYVGSWQFAENQWDIIGAGQADDNRDLFGWGTGDAPNKVSETSADYTTYTEWGTQMGAGWYTLDYDEWKYIFKTRANAANLYAPANVNGVNGIVLLPDDWKQPDGTTFTAGVTNFGTNVYADEAWTAMENAGAVFLPVAGYRYKGNINWVGQSGFYWTSTVASAGSLSWSWLISASSVSRDYYNLYYGMSVRLVNAAGAGPIDAAQAAVALINAIPDPVTLDEACVKAIKDAREAVTALGEASSLIDAADMAKLTKAEADYTNLIKAEADKVIAKINNIPTPVTLKLATRDSIESARAAYDALNADQQALVSNYAVLTAAEATWAGLINAAPAGALSGKYTINAEGDVIYFAHGNLQYIRESLDADWSTGTFRLATNQYDLIEADPTYPAAYCTDNYGDKTAVGLFGWGTWGEGKTPNLTCSDRTLYTWSTDFSGTLEGTNTWRTLTKDEWVYLLAHNNQSYATVHGVNGLLVAPDGKDIDGKSMADWVVINDETWTTMQNDGYLFLPACGQRSQMSATANITTGDQGEDVVYYSSTQYSDAAAHNIWYKPGQDPAADDYSNKRQAFGIRLVSAGVNPLDQVQVVKDLIDAIPVPVTLDDACVNAIQAARDAYDALSEDAQGIIDAATVQKLTNAEQALMDLNQAEADKVVAKINNIPTPVELKLATRDSINNARAAYDALSAAQQALVTNYQTLLDAEAALKAYISLPDGALNGQFTINAAGDRISFAKGNLQATTADLGEHWTWDVAANQWEVIGAEVANTAIIGSGKVSANGTVDMFGWSTPATYFGIYHTMDGQDYLGDFVDWGTNMGAGWRTLAIDEWEYLLKTRENAANLRGQATVNGVHGMILLPNDWTTPTGLTFTAMPNNWNTNVYADADWTAMEEAGAVFLPVEGTRWEQALYSTDGGNYWSSTPAEDAQTAKYMLILEETQILGGVEWMTDYGGRDNGISVRLAAFSVNPLDDAQAVKDLIDAIPTPVEFPTSGPAIAAALNAYDALSDAAKGALDAADVQKLTDAAAAYEAARPFAPITTAPAAVAGLKYTGAAQALITAGEVEHGTLYYSLDGENWSEELPTAISAGAYTVYYKVTATDDYKDVAPQTIAADIAKADIDFAMPTAVEGLVYTTKNQTLIAAGESEDGTFQYKVGENGTWVDTLPKVTDAGTYQVYYKVQGDANHNDYIAEEPITVTIAKAALTITAENKEVVYGFAAPGFSVSYYGLQGSDLPANVLTGELSFTCSYAIGSNAGEYDITPGGQTSANYDITYVKGKLVVYKADPTFTEPVANTLTYNGGAQTLVAAGTTEHGTFEYTFTPNDEESWNTALPQAKNADTYGVYYRIVGDHNHNDYESADAVVVTIAKAALTATADSKEVIYGDAVPAYTVTYAGWQGEDNADVLSGTIAYACEYAQTSNVGEYDIIPSGVSNPDYAITFVNGKVTVSKAALTITADNKEVIYGDEAPAFTASYEGWKNEDNETVVSGLTLTSEYVLTSNVGEYDIVPANAEAQNYAISYTNGTLTVNKAALTITAEDKTVIYGDEAPEYTAQFEGFKNEDNELELDEMSYTCAYEQGSSVGTYAITPVAEDINYEITVVPATLTVNKAVVKVSGAEAQIAKIESGTTDAVVLNAGTLEGIKFNDAVAHETTASFSDASVGEGKTITLYYTLTGDAALLANYDLNPTSEIFTVEGVIIEDFIPAEEGETEKEDDEAQIEEGIEVYAYGYCDGSGYSLRYHLNSGNPDQYKIDFDNSRFEDVDWTNLVTPGKDGTIDIEIPVDLPTGDYTMTVTFRDSRFDWLPSNPMSVTFHVNLPETYTMPLFENTIALVDTCNCFTDIQWYYRADASEAWQPIAGATGYYYRPEGGAKLTGEYFVKASMNGEPTYTCPQTDMETLYEDDKQQPKATVKAFPNPVVNTTVVSIENSENYEHSLRIVNLTGVEMFRTTFEGNETVVRMDGFVQGNYMISVDGIVVKVMKK